MASFDWSEAAGEQILAAKFLEGHALGGFWRFAPGEKLLIAIIEVLGQFLSNFRFPRWGKLQRSKSAENFGSPIRHFQPP
jgi:hypothetical protein